MVYCDNQSCIRLSENPVFHDCSKHIDIRYHFLWDRVQKGAMALRVCSDRSTGCDILTKPLAKGKFKMFRRDWVGGEHFPH
jgi:hypothetical protein